VACNRTAIQSQVFTGNWTNLDELVLCLMISQKFWKEIRLTDLTKSGHLMGQRKAIHLKTYTSFLRFVSCVTKML